MSCVGQIVSSVALPATCIGLAVIAEAAPALMSALDPQWTHVPDAHLLSLGIVAVLYDRALESTAEPSTGRQLSLVLYHHCRAGIATGREVCACRPWRRRDVPFCAGSDAH